jgi:diguanylate cyclase (GGDEF)-like protein
MEFPLGGLIMSKKPLILIVDNDVENCNLLRDFVESMGYDTIIETDGKKILFELEKIEYDLMFLEIHLDSVSGIDILKKSKKAHPNSEAIIITGHGSEETFFKGMNNGAMSYIQKPISYSEIKFYIDQALAKRRYNIKTTDLKKSLELCDRSLVDHVTNMVKFDKLSTFLNLTIDIEALTDLILNGVADIIPGYYYSFFFHRDINREIVIYSDMQVYKMTASVIERQIKEYYENLINLDMGDHYTVRVILPSNMFEREENITGNLSSFFVPVIVNNSFKGVLGISSENKPIQEVNKDILLMISARISKILSNATIQHDTKMLASTDALTGLLNRHAFHERFNQEYERFRRYGSFLSLVVADCDNLKMFNDTYGHPAGDEVLRNISHILRENTRGSDVVARYGGDEFVILLLHSNSMNAFNIAKRFNKKVEDYVFLLQDQKLKTTISTGVATVPNETIHSQEDFLDSADQALYEAKLKGKNQVCMAGPFHRINAQSQLKKKTNKESPLVPL